MIREVINDLRLSGTIVETDVKRDSSGHYVGLEVVINTGAEGEREENVAVIQWAERDDAGNFSQEMHPDIDDLVKGAGVVALCTGKSRHNEENDRWNNMISAIEIVILDEGQHLPYNLMIYKGEVLSSNFLQGQDGSEKLIIILRQIKRWKDKEYESFIRFIYAKPEAAALAEVLDKGMRIKGALAVKSFLNDGDKGRFWNATFFAISPPANVAEDVPVKEVPPAKKEDNIDQDIPF